MYDMKLQVVYDEVYVSWLNTLLHTDGRYRLTGNLERGRGKTDLDIFPLYSVSKPSLSSEITAWAPDHLPYSTIPERCLSNIQQSRICMYIYICGYIYICMYVIWI